MKKILGAMLLLLILPFLILRLAGGLGLLTYGIFCMLLLPRSKAYLSISDQERIGTPYRFFVWVAVFVVVASAIAWLFYVIVLAEVRTEGAFTGFLLGTPEVQVFWSAAIGLIGATIILGALVWIACFAAVKTGLMSYEGLPLNVAMQVSRDVFLGINKIVQMVKDDDVYTMNKPAGWTARFGGYGFLIVQDGYAAVLEKGGKYTRLVGAGVHGLQSFERVNTVVPLRSLFAEKVFEKIATKDGVLINELKLLIFAKVDDGRDVPDTDVNASEICRMLRTTPGSLFTYNEYIIRQRLWKIFGGQANIKKIIEDVLLAIADTQLRAVINRYTLDDIFVPGDDPMRQGIRDAIKREVAEAINKITQGFLGVTVSGTDIGAIRIPEDAERRLLDNWMADWNQRISRTQAITGKSVKEIEAEAERRAKEIEAEAERRAMITKAKGAAEAIQLIEYEKRDAVESFVRDMSRVAMGASIDLEDLVQFLRIVEDMCRRVVCDDLTARSYIEALKSMAQGEGARIVLPGGQPDFLVSLGEGPAGGKQ